MFPRTIAPSNDTNLVMKTGRCSDKNAVSQEALVGVCLISGEWNISKNAKCLCQKGYELTDLFGCRGIVIYEKCKKFKRTVLPYM